MAALFVPKAALRCCPDWCREGFRGFGKLLTARRLSALCAFSCAWVHFSRRLDCAHLYSTTRLPARENTGEAPSTGAMLRKNSIFQGKEMAKSKSMNTLLTAIAVVECERSEEGEFDHRPSVGASQPSESTATLPDFASAATPRR